MSNVKSKCQKIKIKMSKLKVTSKSTNKLKYTFKDKYYYKRENPSFIKVLKNYIHEENSYFLSFFFKLIYNVIYIKKNLIFCTIKIY